MCYRYQPCRSSTQDMLLYCFIPPPDPPHTLTGVTFRPRPSSTSATRRQTVHSCVPQTSVWGEGRRAVAMETLRMPSPSGEWLEVHSAFLRENVSNFLYPPLSPSSPSPPSPSPPSSPSPPHSQNTQLTDTKESLDSPFPLVPSSLMTSE